MMATDCPSSWEDAAPPCGFSFSFSFANGDGFDFIILFGQQKFIVKTALIVCWQILYFIYIIDFCLYNVKLKASLFSKIVYLKVKQGFWNHGHIYEFPNISNRNQILLNPILDV